MTAVPCRRLTPLSLLLLFGLLPLLLGQGEEGRRYALVIGVNAYKKDQFRPLKYAENDADALADFFEKTAGFRRVVKLTFGASKDNPDLAPTARNIREELTSLLKRRTERD